MNSVDQLIEQASKDELKTSVLNTLESQDSDDGTILPGKTVEDKLKEFEAFLDNSPRKFRRQFVKESFAERIRKAAAKKLNKNETV